MTPDTATASESVADSTEVMASIDRSGASKRLVIADVTMDDAWISMRCADETSLPDWQ